MKNFGKILISLFAAALLICMLAIAASAANIGKGSYNDSGFAWSLDNVDGNIILTITDTEETKELTTFTWKTSAGETPNWNKKYTYMVEEVDYLTKITEVIYKADASTIGGYTHNARKIRIAGIFINSPLWIVYDILVGSWAGVLDELISEASMIISICRYGWKNLDKVEE